MLDFFIFLDFLHHVKMTLGVLFHDVFDIVGFPQLVKLFLSNEIFHFLNAPDNILLVWSYAKSYIKSSKVTFVVNPTLLFHTNEKRLCPD